MNKCIECGGDSETVKELKKKFSKLETKLNNLIK